MKTLELKLKKDLLIVEVDKSFNHFKIYNDEIGFIFIENSIPRKELIKGSYKFLCKGSELTEEVLINFIDVKRISSSEGEIFPDFKNKGWLFGKPNRYRSFISAVESKGFYWLENHIGKPINYDLWAKYGDYTHYGKVLTEKCLKWKEAEEKTFKNPLIFVKK